MKIQQSDGGGWDKGLIEKMSKFEFCKTESIYELKHQLKTDVCFFFIFIRKNSVAVNQISILMNKVEMNKTIFIANFDRDASFRIKFFY